MKEETKYYRLLYPISPAYASSLKGVFSPFPATLGQVLTFHGNNYQVHKIREVKARLFVSSGVLKLYHGYDVMDNKDKINAFLNRVGLSDQKAFISAFFNNCEVIGTVAERTIHLNCFISSNPFEEKW